MEFMGTEDLIERAYGKLEYLKGYMDALYFLREEVGLEIPALAETSFNLTSQKFQSGDYEGCLDICIKTINLVKEYVKTKGQKQLKKLLEVE